MKGMIHFEGQELPSVVQAVQHIRYPLENLPFQRDAKASRLVLIGQEMSRHELISALEELAQLANR